MRRKDLHERKRDDEGACSKRDQRSYELACGAPDRLEGALPPLDTVIDDLIALVTASSIVLGSSIPGTYSAGGRSRDRNRFSRPRPYRSRPSQGGRAGVRRPPRPATRLDRAGMLAAVGPGVVGIRQ